MIVKSPKKKVIVAKEVITPMKPAAGTVAAEDMRWKAHDALQTLKRAHEIKQDSHLMGHVKAHAATEKKALTSVMRRKT